MQLMKRIRSRAKQAGFDAWSRKHSVAMPIPGRPGTLAFKDESSKGETNDAAMTAKFVISSVNADRHGDIVRPEGCKETLKTYLENPVVLLNHQHQGKPIATARQPDGQVALEITPTQILSVAHFSNASDESRQVYALVKEGILCGASIGFRARLARRLHDPYADSEGDLSYDMINFEENQYGLEFLKWELLEWSIVGVPANPDALVIQTANDILSKGMFDSRPLASRVRSVLQPLARPRQLWETYMTKSLSAPLAGTPKTWKQFVKELEEGEAQKAVQALLVPKDTYPEVADAAAKVDELGLDSSDVDEYTIEDTSYWAFIQFEPDLCLAESVEHETLEGGMIAVTCAKAEEDQEENKGSRVASRKEDGSESEDESKSIKRKSGACGTSVCACKKRTKTKDADATSQDNDTDDKPVVPGVALAKAIAHVLNKLMPHQENPKVKAACVKTVKIWKGVCDTEYPDETFAWPEDELADELNDDDAEDDDEETKDDDTNDEDEEKSKSLLSWRKMSKKRRAVCRDATDWMEEHAKEPNLTRAQKAACKYHHAALSAMLAEMEDTPDEDGGEFEALLAEALVPMAESTKKMQESFARLTGVRV